MKKVILSVAVFTALIAVSCKKEQIAPNQVSAVSTATETPVKKAPISTEKLSGLRVFFDNGKQPGTDGVDYGCSGSGGNCLPDVVVSPSRIVRPINAVLTAVVPGIETVTRNVFALNRVELLNFVSAENVDGVISGVLTATLRGISPLETRYLIIKNKATKAIVAVYPFKAN